MPYVASTERMGIEQGRQEERSRQRSLILRQLVRQVGAVPEPLTDRISKGCDLNSIQLKGDRKPILVELIPELIPTSRC